MTSITRRTLLACLAVIGGASTVHADEVTDWNANLFRAALVAPATSPLVMTRNTAIVQAAVFDALNGIERRLDPGRNCPRNCAQGQCHG